MVKRIGKNQKEIIIGKQPDKNILTSDDLNTEKIEVFIGEYNFSPDRLNFV